MAANGEETMSEAPLLDSIDGDAPSESIGTTNQRRATSSAFPPVIFFDGVCGLCNCFVDFMLRRRRGREFRYSPLQGETARQRLEGNEWATLNSIVFLDEKGEHGQSAAIVRILRRLGGLWNIAGILLWLIPRPLRDLGYRSVAASRYRLFGKKETCRLPSNEEKECFLP